jgi:hypothetical protein
LLSEGTGLQQSRLKYEFRDALDWIRVIDVHPERHRYLHFHESIQGVMSLDSESQPVLEYIGLMLEMAKLLHADPYRVLLGGLGSCTLLHAISKWLGHQSRIIAVESNQTVLDLARRFFRLNPKQKVLMGDLRDQLNGGYLDRLDLAMIDCYTAEHMPHHLTSLEFMQSLYSCMQSGGVAIFNIWSADCNPICQHQLRTLAHCFDEVAFVKCQEDQNLVVMVRKPLAQGSVLPWPRSIVYKKRDYAVRVVRESYTSDWRGFLYGGEIIEDGNLDKYIRLSHEFQPH